MPRPTDDGSTPRAARTARITLASLAALVLLYLAPLAISVIEHSIFGSQHVEDWARSIGIHTTIDNLYAPLKALLRHLR